MGGSSGPASAGGYYMEQYAGMDMGGSSGSASETNRRKPFRFYGWLPVAQLICWELYFVSLDAETHIFFVGAFLYLLNPISFAADVLSAFTHRSCVRYDRSRGRLPLL